MRKLRRQARAILALSALFAAGVAPLQAQQVTYKPYIQPGDNSTFGATDGMVIAWQTSETSPSTAYSVQFGKTTAYGHTVNPVGRVVDNYLAVDSILSTLTLPYAYGAHTNYYAVLSGLDYDTTYYYKVTGPGLPTDGFTAFFHTRKKGTSFSFQVQGDEGYYPGVPNSSPAVVADYEARIIHTMYHVNELSFPGEPALPFPDLALNTGDNVYLDGSDNNYRDIWMPDWNSDADTNEYGSPFIRRIPYYIVVGNHDIGNTGAGANLLGTAGATVPGAFGPAPYGGNIGGGDALAYFNNYYFPLNGPVGADIQNRFKGDASTPSDFNFSYNGTNYSSPAAIEALRASSTVDTGKGTKRQIDRESNYSFDYGNTHFVFLDANPHLFDNQLPGGTTYGSPITFPFPTYPSLLRNWLINDLDSSKQTWKVVVYHQPAFSSGNATVRNDQMRRVAKFLEDHGVNMVFNGHEHNYQRSLPIRALPGVDAAPVANGAPVVAVDTAFDGKTKTTPDGVLYFVEGAGGNRDFDDDLPNPRGGGAGIDQDDAATGAYTPAAGQIYNNNGTSFVNGVASFLDTRLTNQAMTPYLPGAGSGQKITAKFKSKIFSFADIIVNDNTITLYQITEPLKSTSSATQAKPAPYGTDINGNPLNDPISDTIFDPIGRTVLSVPETGTPALLDKIVVTKPSVATTLGTVLSAPTAAAKNGALVYTVGLNNGGTFGLNGTQIVLTLPAGVTYVGTDSNVTVQGQDVVLTIGRLAVGDKPYVQIKTRVGATVAAGTVLTATAVVRSATALPVSTNSVSTKVANVSAPPIK